MDPNEALKAASAHIEAEQYTDALINLIDYLIWRRKGGFAPDPKADRWADDNAYRCIDLIEGKEY
jgi:hypothetical protein